MQMSFINQRNKGLNSYFVDESLSKESISIHISELEPGKSSHEPHAHNGIESYYVLSGRLAITLGEEVLALSQNEAASINARRPHKVTNSGDAINRYMVIIAKQ